MYRNQSERSEAKKALAAELKVSVREVNRRGLCDKPLESVKNRKEKAENAQKHRENCEKHAKAVAAGDLTVKDAAEACEVTIRQMYRWVNKVTLGAATCSTK